MNIIKKILVKGDYDRRNAPRRVLAVAAQYFRHFFVYYMLHESVYNMDINCNNE